MNPRRLAGFAAWLAAGAPIAILTLKEGFPPGVLAPGVAAFLAFGAAYAILTKDRDVHLPRAVNVALLAVQSLAALALAALFRTGFEGILPVVVAAQLIFFLSVRVSVVWVLAQTAAYAWFISRRSSPWIAVVVAMAYLSFQAFALYTTWVAEKEAAQRVELSRLNAELHAAQDLLAASSRLAERDRISRDLHDVMGHHLTALTLNLEVASHLASGEARTAVEKARAVAKLLLADVRDVVSRFREDHVIDVKPALLALARALPHPEIDVQVDNDVRVADPALAETLVRCVQEAITNAAKHSRAKRLAVRVSVRDGGLVVTAQDDGRGAAQVREGHGLTGMRERVSALGGTLEIETAEGRGFGVVMKLPGTAA
ncbi:MAG TPA: sensor histidine kinase [Thermoanaerobaculia bacterium]|nr:sensor histidine kinase [Thermoanaerobaculia bacterium]